ncbi:TonB-dependent receptor plug domain-containing protein [Novosphingobium rosa]|uniref:TonB-dependent receptor plug domain-containing protein n=1 Tax=Novosphingobium rosa TaxID=76978 RepID=UPI000A04FBFC|nr:TonB-dependent receptor [Novosphingobium rosa]
MKVALYNALLGSAAPLVLSACLMSGTAFAQDAAKPEEPKAEEAQTIVVTGSILRRTNTETPAPVTTLTFSELSDRGVNTVSEGLQRMAANGSGALSEGWNNGSNFATGANAVSLRGLTVQATLTLFNGLRMAPYPKADDGHRNFVDLGTIPDAVVEKIDVLKDSASSTYGADAVAGVVNVIMKKEIKGIHLDASSGISQRGDGGERAVDLTAGYGDLREKGWNIYVSGTYRKKDVINVNSRDYPFNNGDLSGLCDGAGHCVGIASSGLQFGQNADGTLSGGTTTIAPLVRPITVSSAGAISAPGIYSQLNTTGCSAFGLKAVTLTPSQQLNPSTGAPLYNANQCQQDLRAQYRTLRPDTERYGFVVHGVADLGDRAQLTGDFEYMHVKTSTQLAPQAFASQTTPSTNPTDPVKLTNVILPVYVCANGVGTIRGASNISTGCSAANGVLNPNNPYAAAGQTAQLKGLYDRPVGITSNTTELHGALGVQGQLGKDDEWNYSLDFTASHVRLGLLYENYLIPQRIADVAATGAYNFVSPWLNSQAIRDYISPAVNNVSTSDLWQVQAQIQRRLFELPGGPAQLAVGGAYRHEAITNPSANPANAAAPYMRYYGLNAVAASGSRNVRSGFFALGLPLLKSLEFDASGRYDSYSSGQSNFSPKLEAKFTPIRQFALRGTWSKGFRIPSFNEASGDPTTGYTQPTVNCAVYTTFCAAHGNNGYATAAYSLGRTSFSNANLKPEKSTSWTLGTIIEPNRHLSFTVDYYNIKIKDLVSGLSSTAQNAVLDAYLKNGTTTGVVPGVTVVPGTVDPANQSAQALPGFIQFQFNNAGKEEVQGIDFGANARYDLGHGLKWASSFDGNYLIKYQLTTADNTVERFDGTLSPCDTSSCSGSPKWRFTWANTISKGKVSLTATTYFTSGYDLAEVDYGGVAGDCLNSKNIGAGIVYYKGTTTPVACRAKATWNVDLSGKVKVTDNFTVYANVLNVLGIKPTFDPSAAYGNYNFNPTWGMANIIGRYFRIGAKVDF